jgi:nicotinamidase-related amidase
MNLISSEQAAVLVIDVQVGLFSMDPPPFEGERLIARINQVTAAARAARVPVFFVQQDGGPEENLAPFTKGWRLHPSLQIQPEDRILRKTACDAFYRSPLESELRARNIGTVIIMGYATDFCIDATIRNCVSKDFHVLVIADGHTTSDSPVLKAELIRRHHNWVWPNCVSTKPIEVLEAGSLHFASREKAA